MKIQTVQMFAHTGLRMIRKFSSGKVYYVGEINFVDFDIWY